MLSSRFSTAALMTFTCTRTLWKFFIKTRRSTERGHKAKLVICSFTYSSLRLKIYYCKLLENCKTKSRWRLSKFLNSHTTYQWLSRTGQSCIHQPFWAYFIPESWPLCALSGAPFSLMSLFLKLIKSLWKLYCASWAGYFLTASRNVSFSWHYATEMIATTIKLFANNIKDIVTTVVQKKKSNVL